MAAGIHRAVLGAALGWAALPAGEPPPAPAAPSLPAAGTPFGVHLVESDYARASWAEDLKRISPGWVRVNLGSKARAGDALAGPAAAAWEARLAAIRRAGCRVFATVYARVEEGCGFPEGEDARAAWARYAEAVVARFADAVDVWQLDNELTLDHNWKTAPRDKGAVYASLWTTFADAVRRRDGSARLAPFGLTSLRDWDRFAADFLPALAKAGAPFDVLDIHLHTPAGRDAELAEAFLTLRPRIEEAVGRPLAFVSTECSTWEGAPPGLRAQDAGEMAATLATKQVALAAAGFSFACFGPLVNRRAWRGEAVHRFSLNGLFAAGADGAPREAFRTACRLNALWRRLAPARCALAEAPPPLRQIVLRGADGTPAGFFLWSEGEPVSWSPPEPFGSGADIHPLVAPEAEAPAPLAPGEVVRVGARPILVVPRRTPAER